MLDNKLKIFSYSRLKFSELYEDAKVWIRRQYNATDETFAPASAFNILLTVLLNLAKMIFYYIEDSITGLNIKTSYRPDQIRGLAQLTGHNSSRALSARAACRIIYKNTGNMDLTGKVCYIPNKTKLISNMNGEEYILLLGYDTGKITMSTAGNYLNANIIQGTLKYQRATGTGNVLQSYNFNEKTGQDIEEQFINIYINSEPWEIVSSILDLGFQQKGCVVKTGQTGGIDIFFGNGDFGMVPPEGSTILCEYIVTDGIAGNLGKEYVNQTDNAWQIQGNGYLSDGSQISLNDNFYISLTTDVIFGSMSEDIALTQMIAPHMSRSFVLANETNYKYFFKRMNMFSVVEIIKGYSSKEANTQARISYDQRNAEYSKLFDLWHEAVSMYGESSNEAQELNTKLQNAMNAVQAAREKVDATDMKDNTVYIMLIPDISKRISSSVNYFTCDESAFTLSDDEQYNLLQLIENSGQKIITMENRIIQPKLPRFAINANVKIWEGFNLESVYADCIQKLSDYLISFNRKDMIPVSDIVALFEAVDGIDSVKVWFDADVANSEIYGKENYYGIDEFGDVVLTRDYTTSTGSVKQIRDILPLFRGGFVSPTGIEYSMNQSNDYSSAFNLNLVSYTQNTKLSLENPIN